MRLIDADSLKERMFAEIPEHEKGVVDIFLEAVAAMIDEQPTIERKTGEWIIQDNPGTGWYRVVCSECDEDVTSNIPMIGFFPHCKPLWDYCPYCGADMRGDDHETD